MGHKDDADQLLEAWGHRQANECSLQTDHGFSLSLSLDLLCDLSTELVTQLYSAQLDALAGHSLESLPGVDYGPHQAAQTLAVKESFLKGVMPSTRHPHRIIAGAVLAWQTAPHREDEFLQRCRVAMIGQAEWSEPTLAPSLAPQEKPSSPRHRAREAFLLNTILGPPKGRLLGKASSLGFGRAHSKS